MDDDAGLRRLVQRALERRGFAVTTAADADEGLALLGAGGYDLVAIDHYMPGRSGRELLDDIVARPDHPPVVFVTGNDDTQIAVEAIHAGASDFVVKTVGESFFDLLAGRFRQALTRDQLVKEKRQVEADLRTANERLEMLMREVHHRVSNSLQMVLSFVSMQAAQTADPAAKDALQATQNRIQAISKVHHRLYTRDDLTTIDLDDYLQTLVGELRASLDKSQRSLTLEFRADPIEVTPDEAVSVGVVTNELVTNAAKYAFVEGDSGTIRIDLGRTDAGYRLTVGDNGQGFDGSVSPQGSGLGMRIVSAIARSLGSDLEYLPADRGTTVQLSVVHRCGD